MDGTRKVPVAALRFDAAPVDLSPATEAGQPRKFDGVAYSGGVIPNHFFWGNVVFDLATTKAPAKLPILVEHDRAQRAGVAKATIGNDVRVSGRLLANASGASVASDADAGFPWQMSVHIEPGRIEEVQPGAVVEVNGQALTGPLTIFRDSTIREASFTPTGADAHTSARVFAGADDTIEVPIAAIAASNEDLQMSQESDQRIAALEADLATAQAAITAANERADAAEAALAGLKASAREADIKALFAAIGREFTEDAAKPYRDLSAETFASVAADLRAAVPKPSPHLFTEHAVNGATNHAQVVDTTAIYAARRAKD